MLINLCTSISFATNEMLEAQVESSGINLFLDEAQKYVSKDITDIDINEIFSSSLSRKIKS